MTYALDPVAAGWVLLGLVLGLLIGRLTWGRAARRHRRAAESVSNAAAAAAARTQADQAQRELAAAHAAMRPLADEVDRLKRDLAKAKRPVQPPLPLTADAALPAAPPVASDAGPAPHVAPTAAVAGAGPVVVAATGAAAGTQATETATATAPDVRQLKGVGDKFAAALGAIGLASVDRLARLNNEEAAEADTQLGAFNGRIARDQLVEQAVLLDEGRTTEYEARFGKLGGPVLV